MTDEAVMKNNIVKHKTRFLAGLCCILLFTFALAACGVGKEDELGGGSTPGTPTTVDMSAMGINTKTAAHATWVTTTPHNTYACNDCHSVDSEKVCAQSGCHPFSKYTALATNFDHTANKTGEQCNKCHSLTPEPTATDAVRIAGWRENVKQQVSDTKWHTALKGVCLNCHDPVQHNANNISVFPASHQTDPARQTACETCHYYKLNSAGTAGTWGGGHTNATSGCNVSGCHSKHYSGYDCAWCHSGAISNGYASWKNTWNHEHESNSGCGACHGAGGVGD
ncbi:MAG: hypothetical protein HZA03_00275 [Nitrospinae bacterium]|nr:hypothetical protein [Nitrospinota bacterium]